MTGSTPPRRALVVHPDASTCRALKAELERRGYQVEPCLGPECVPCAGVLGMPCAKLAWAAAGAASVAVVSLPLPDPGAASLLASYRRAFGTVLVLGDGPYDERELSALGGTYAEVH